MLDATVAELIDHGCARLSVEGVAARAGVNKTTVYRRWGGKDGLIVDTVETFAAAEADGPDSGDIDEDLHPWARSILRTLTGPVSGALVRAAFGGAATARRCATCGTGSGSTRSTLIRPVVDRAVQSGQLPAGTDADDVIRHVGAPLYYRLLVLAEPLTPETARLAAAVTSAAAHAGVFVPSRNGMFDPGRLRVRQPRHHEPHLPAPPELLPALRIGPRRPVRHRTFESVSGGYETHVRPLRTPGGVVSDAPGVADARRFGPARTPSGIGLPSGPWLAHAADRCDRSGDLLAEHRAHSLLGTALRSAGGAVVTDLDARPDRATASTVSFDRQDLPVDPLAARTARHYLVSCLTDVAPDAIDVVLLLASELVTNAVQHGSAPIRLQLHRRGATLRVEISDAGVLFAMTPMLAWSRTAEGGRGLPLVNALARDWGSQPQADTSPGKTIWFELSCDPAEVSLRRRNS